MKKTRTTIRAVVCVCALIASSVSMAAEWLNWTGGAGDGLWSSAGNWTNATGEAVAPTPGQNYGYRFKDYPSGLVVTQDIAVVTEDLSIWPPDTALETQEITFETTEAGSLCLTNYPTISLRGRSHLTLRCDMSPVTKDTSRLTVTIGGGAALSGEAKVTFACTKASAVRRILRIYGGIVEAANEESLGLFNMNLIGETARFVIADDARACTILSESPLSSLGSILLQGHELRLGRDGASTAINVFNDSVRSEGGSVYVGSQRRLALRHPFVDGGRLELGSGDVVFSGNTPYAFAYDFEDAENPLKDPRGLGETLVAPAGMPSVVDDPVRGKVLSFDGKKYLQGPIAVGGTSGGLESLPAGTSNLTYTIALWLKPDGACNTKGRILCWGLGVNSKFVGFRLNNSTTQSLQFTIYGTEKTIPTANAVTDGAWHHAAVVYRGSRTYDLYYDGVWQTSMTVPTTKPLPDSPNRNLNIGSCFADSCWKDGTNPYTGLVDDFVVANYAMTDVEIAKLASDGLPPVAPMALKASGTGSFIATNGTPVVLGGFSGAGTLGGLETAGAKVTVGRGTSETQGVYSASVRGTGETPVTLVKEGADYEQVFQGTMENVAGVEVKEGTFTLRQSVARRGLLLYHSFDDPNDLLRDDSLVGTPLLYAGTAPVAAATSVRGGAVTFATNTYLHSGTTMLPSGFPVGNAPFTLSVWIRPTAAAMEGKGPICFWGNGATGQEFILRFNSDGLLMSNWGSSGQFSVKAALADGNWHHLVATYDSVTRKNSLYVDGTLAGSATRSTDLNVTMRNSLQIGRSTGDTNYEGDMDEFMVFDYAWTAAEVAAEFAHAAPTPATAAEVLPLPVAHWTFDDADNLGRDVSGNGLDLAVVGTKATAAADAFTCGGVVKLAGSSYLTVQDGKYDTSLLPWSSNAFTVVCRYKCDRVQDDYGGTVFSAGEIATSANLKAGKLVKISTGDGSSISARFAACGATDASLVDTDRVAVSTDRQRWVTAAMVYAPASGDKTHVLKYYYDGNYIGGANSKTMNISLARFDIGADLNPDNARKNFFLGLVDDVQVYNRALSPNEIDAVTRRLAAGAGKSAACDPTLIPKTATLSVADGATLSVQAPVTVASVSGAGTVTVGTQGRLAVGSYAGFTGTLTGAGVVAIPDGMTLDVGSGEGLPLATLSGSVALGKNVTVRTSAAEGTYVLMTAGAGFIGAENLATWQVVSEQGALFGVRLSKDGRSLQLRWKRGLAVIVR